MGMDNFNAMFEDATTKSWWRQENGLAIAGALKGTYLPELPSAQMTVSDWLALHPNSLILQRDTNFKKQYADLIGYDEDTLKSSLEKRDTASWKMKSWVTGVSLNNKLKVYDWNMVMQKIILEDSLANTPILISAEQNGKTVYVLSRKIDNDTLHFTYNAINKLMEDEETKSL